jgi:hypothetical protein
LRWCGDFEYTIELPALAASVKKKENHLTLRRKNEEREEVSHV